MLKAKAFQTHSDFKRAFVSIFLRLALLVKQLLAAVIHRAVLMLKAKAFQSHSDFKRAFVSIFLRLA